jgi:hypothetical protein
MAIALALTLGAHWTVLESVGWFNMFVSFDQ